MENQYDSMTLVKLRKIAKEKGMKNIASLKKSELIEALKKHDSNESNTEESTKNVAPIVPKGEKRPSGHSEMEQLDSGETKEAFSKITDGYGLLDVIIPSGENCIYISGR